MLLYVHRDRTDYYGRGAQDVKPRTGSQEPRSPGLAAQEPRTGSPGLAAQEPRTGNPGAQEPRTSTRLIFHTVHS